MPVIPVAEMGKKRLVLFRSAHQGQFTDPCSGKRGWARKTKIFSTEISMRFPSAFCSVVEGMREKLTKPLRASALIFQLKNYVCLPDPATFSRAWVRELTLVHIRSFCGKAVSCNVRCFICVFGQFLRKAKFAYGQLWSCDLGYRPHMCAGDECAEAEGSGRCGRMQL